MFDVHCHLLPGLDDGPRSVEDSIALANALIADGITHVVATPHVFPGRYNNTADAICEATDVLARLFRVRSIPLKLGWAGEVRMCVESLSLLKRGEVPVFEGNNGRFVLIEMPDGGIPIGAAEFLMEFIVLGITPVIAHPERNRSVLHRPECMRPFVNMGCRLQLTAGSVLGMFGRRAQMAALRLLDDDQVFVIASDAHNLGSRRPVMAQASRALTRRYGENRVQQLMVNAPASMMPSSA